MPDTSARWSQVARDVSRRLAGLDKATRVGRVREEAARLGLEAHTLRRYLVVLDFLDRLGVGEDDARCLPLGPLEVILRIWAKDPSVAGRALRLLGDGKLTFRRALAIESNLKSARPDAGGLSALSSDQSSWFRGQVARTLDIPVDELMETSQIDNPRFDLVQAQRTYATVKATVALLDEAALTEIVGSRFVARLARDALIAGALYDKVVVALAFTRSAVEFDAYMRLAGPDWSGRVHILVDDRDLPAIEGTDD